MSDSRSGDRPQPARSHELSEPVRRAIGRFNRSLPADPARDRAIELVEREHVRFFVTGQQLGLFGGPLLTLYKTLTAVRLADERTRSSGAPVLPVFWLQGDDHDLLEVESATFPAWPADAGSSGQPVRTVSLEMAPAERDAHRISVAEVALPDRIVDLTDAVIAAIGQSPAAPEVVEALRAGYRPGRSFQDAFVTIMAELCRGLPVLFFDSRSAEVRPLRSSFFERAFLVRSEIDRLLVDGSEARETQGAHDRVKVRPGSPLFFFAPDGASGPRYRLQEDGGGFSFIGRPGRISEGELVSALRDRPEAFSTSALLRPLLQDSLLPSCGYAAGAAELEYYEQIRPLFPLFGLPEPNVVPRASFTLLEARAARLLDQLGLSLAELGELDAERFLRRVAGRPSDSDPLVALREDIRGALDRARGKLGEIDQSLPGALDRTSERILRSLDGLSEKYLSALERKHAVARDRFERARSLLLPDGAPQERVLNGAAFVARYGMPLRDELLARINPADPPAHAEVVDISGRAQRETHA